MKRYIFIFTLLILFLSCGKPPQVYSEKDDVYMVTEDLVERYLCMNGFVGTKSSCKIEPIIKTGKTIMYMVNYDEHWELLSADSRVPVVIAEGEGYMSYSQLSSNSILAYLFDSIEDNLFEIRQSDYYSNDGEDTWERIIPPSRGWSDWFFVGFTDTGGSYTAGYLSHLIMTKWGQGYPWNVTSPLLYDGYAYYHTNTGCVMVASSQIIYYLHNNLGEPNILYGNCSISDYIPVGYSLVLNSGNTSFYNLSSAYWSDMPLKASDVTGTNNYPVSTLMTYLGMMLGAVYYGNSSTGAPLNTIPDVFSTEYGISCEHSSVDMDEVFNQITYNHMPCIK